MTTIQVLSSPLFDRIAQILVTTGCRTMAPASLYRWFAKGISYDVADTATFTHQLRTCAQTGEPPAPLAQKVQDFPQMFSCFGGDLVGSDEALALLDRVRLLLGGTADDAGKNAFIGEAATH